MSWDFRPHYHLHAQAIWVKSLKNRIIFCIINSEDGFYIIDKLVMTMTNQLKINLSIVNSPNNQSYFADAICQIRVCGCT